VVARGITTGSHTRNSGRINGEEEVASTIIRIRRIEVAGIATSDEVDGRVVDGTGRPIAKPFNA